MGRAILAVISAAALIAGLITLFRSVYVLFRKLIGEDDLEPAKDFTDKLIEAVIGFGLLGSAVMFLMLLYLIGVRFILPIFGL